MAMFLAFASVASAHRGGFALKKTTIGYKPYNACAAPAPGHARCLAVVDPTARVAPVSRVKAGGGTSPAFVFCLPGEYEYCGSGFKHGLSPQDLQSAYKLPSASAGAGQTVAIVDAFDDPNAQSDLNVYRSTYGLPPCEAGCFKKVNQTGGTTYPAPNAEWALEISLDIDMVSAACPQCHILLVEASEDSLEDLAIAENEAALLGATEISNSYVVREIEMGKAAVEAYAGFYNHPGIPITAGSGDNGFENENFAFATCSNCSVSFPASLANVISVGGTGLYPTEGESGRGWEEIVWEFSGSGCALYVPKPSWQTDTGCAKRTDNDVAAVASSTTPVSLYDSYEVVSPGWQDVGGTSVSAPLTAAVIALENSTLRSEGLPGIYTHPANWWDVTSETNWLNKRPDCGNYLCHGVLGYDGPSGVGTPHGTATVTPPGALTEGASAVSTTAATINGVVNPEEQSTSYYFEYGGSKLYGHTAPAGGAHVAGYSQPVPESLALTGLKASTLYHYRVVATSTGGTTYGPDVTFATAPAVYSSKFGSAGTEAGHFNTPTFTAQDAVGDIWVSDYANNRVEEFSSAGTYMQSCGTSGTGSGQFSGPTGIAVNPTTGYIYVSDSGNHRLEVFGPTCVFKETFGGPLAAEGGLSKPMGLTFGPSEPARPTLFVADATANKVDEFSWNIPHGELAGSYGGGTLLNGPTDVTLGTKESRYSASLYVVDSGNNRVQIIREPKFCFGCASHLELLGSFGSAGSGAGQLQSPTALALDATTGNLNVTDTANNRVEEFQPSGTYVATFGSVGAGDANFKAPKGIALSPSGTAYIADSANNRIDVWVPSQATDPSWHLLSSENPAGTLNSNLEAVSCSGTEACKAVGRYNQSTGGYLPFAETWNGSSWKSQAMAAPTGSETKMTGVSCSSSTVCSAVGYYLSTSGAYKSLAEVWNGTSWTIQSTPEPTGTTNSLLDGISCSASSACTAVGWYEAGGVEQPFAERWNGTAWAVQTMPQPSGAKTSYPRAVKCLSATSCTAAGYYKTTAGAYVPLAETWNGTTWTAGSMPVPTGSTSLTIGGLSCTSSTSCLAAGYYLSSTGGEVPFSERWNGTAWTVVAMPTPAASNTNTITGLSCGGATSCNAVGVSKTTEGGKYVTLAEHWDGSAWTIQSTPNVAGEDSFLSGGISCHTAYSCAAVGNHHLSLAEIWQ